MYQFELEKGSQKYHCPACSQKWLVRYVRSNTNEHLASDVGRCDRESKCGYHFTPKMYFVENPQAVAASQNGRIHGQAFINKNGSQAKYEAPTLTQKTDYIEKRYLIASLQNYEQNAFVQFLLNLFPDCINEIETAIKNYRVGSTPDGKTIFWQIDQRMRIRTGKIIAYDANTGKRIKSVYPNWIHSELKKYKKVRNDFNLKQCFFGEHLLRNASNKPVCIVEAEKTAVIASICYPEFIWLAIGSKQSLKFERIKQIGRNRKVILYPDADGFDVWNKTANTARTNGFDVIISNLINTFASDKERSEQVDLADYLINEQTEINKQNKFIHSVNKKLSIVKNDAELNEQFNTILDEQKAILIIDGGRSELEAERIISKPENVRSVVLSL
jgi:hypothetical protein